MSWIWEGKQEGRIKERRITKPNNGATGVGRWMVEERGRDRKREGGGGEEKRGRGRGEKKRSVGEKTSMERERRKENVGLRALERGGSRGAAAVCWGK